VDDLHVDYELAAAVADDEDSNAAAAGLEGFGETAPEVGLVDDGEALLNVAGLGHCNNNAILEVKDTVLLEDRAEHSLDDDARAGVRDERRLLVQLLGEEVDAQVAMLTSGGRGRDANDLTRTALQDQQVAEADVVGWDGDGVACRR